MAIVLEQGRPALGVESGEFGTFADPFTHLNEEPVRERLSLAVEATCRVEVPDNPILPYAGSGFLAAPDLVITCRTVAEIVAEGLGLRARMKEGQRASASFGAEDVGMESLASGEDELAVSEVVMIHPYWDLAVLRLESPSSRRFLPLATAAPAWGSDIVVVGYPASDTRVPPVLQDRIFGHERGVKRLMPGRATRVAGIRSYGNVVEALCHDASTMGGCIGAPIVDVHAGVALAVHFAGHHLVANYAVPAWELARDQRFVDLGMQFDGQPSPGPTTWDDAWAMLEQEGTESAPATVDEILAALHRLVLAGFASHRLLLGATDVEPLDAALRSAGAVGESGHERIRWVLANLPEPDSPADPLWRSWMQSELNIRASQLARELGAAE